jgi:glycine cleavage system H lipoate-binding protein
MRCPFLREEQVKSCQSAPFRKQIACATSLETSERCSSPAYSTCPNLRESHTDHPNPARCPFLRDSLVQYCAATPAPTYVPWSDSPDLCCGHDGHRFCDVFLAIVGIKGRRPALPRADPADERLFDVAGVTLPGWLQYSVSHMWLDAGDDGLVHVGLDAFATRWLSSADRLTFLTTKGTVHPAVVLTVKGVDLTLCFPRRLRILSANTHLRFNLERLSADPYGRGWLFRARAAAGADPEAPDAELLYGTRHAIGSPPRCAADPVWSTRCCPRARMGPVSSPTADRLRPTCSSTSSATSSCGWVRPFSRCRSTRRDAPSQAPRLGSPAWSRAAVQRVMP